MPAEYEVRLTPLILGVPGIATEDEAGGTTTIDLADTTLVEQFADIEVNVAINEPRTGKVVLSTHDPLVADLQPFAQALWIAYKRPGATDAEGLVYGQCNVTTDYEAGTVTLDVQDPSQRCQHHYIRRGDDALNIDANRGTMRATAINIDLILAAARNTVEQQDRSVPALGMAFFKFGSFPDETTAPFIEYERGQECWDLATQIMRSVTGPDVDVSPAFAFPAAYYAEVDCWDPPTDPTSPGGLELGRNLDPTDPDAPAAGDVIFQYGMPYADGDPDPNNLAGLVEAPGRPTTHNHVVDADKAFRVTSADADSSAEVGVWVDWTEADFKVPRARTVASGFSWVNVPADTAPLQALADARIRAYGRPPKFFTCTLPPDDGAIYHYGYPYAASPGDWYIGDYVRVRAQRGYRSFSTLARITGVKFRQDGSNGLPTLDVTMIPAVGGSPGDDPQETP